MTNSKEELDHVKRQLKEAEQQNLQLAHDKAREVGTQVVDRRVEVLVKRLRSSQPSHEIG